YEGGRAAMNVRVRRSWMGRVGERLGLGPGWQWMAGSLLLMGLSASTNVLGVLPAVNRSWPLALAFGLGLQVLIAVLGYRLASAVGAGQRLRIMVAWLVPAALSVCFSYSALDSFH